MKSYTIHLIRHGISQGNLLGQYIGVTDSPLSEEGKEQLKQLAEQNSYPYAQAYYTSPLSRCVDSLKLIYPNAEPIVIEGFKECNFGKWEGKSAKDLDMTLILSNGWKVVLPCLRRKGRWRSLYASRLYGV